MRYFSLTEKRQQSQKNRLQSFKSKIQVSFRGFLTQKFYLVIQIFFPFLIILFTATVSISWFSCRIFVFWRAIINQVVVQCYRESNGCQNAHYWCQGQHQTHHYTSKVHSCCSIQANWNKKSTERLVDKRDK